MLDWENLTVEDRLNIDWVNLPLEDRISRLLFCAKKLDNLYNELSRIGVGNLPLDDSPMDYYDKDIATNLDIICGIKDLRKLALARAKELSKLAKHAG